MRARLLLVITVIALLAAAALPAAATEPPSARDEARPAVLVEREATRGDLTATDSSGHGTEDTEELIDDLIDQVRALDLPQWLTRCLTAKLSKALRALDRGFVPRAINRLQVFIDKVETYAGWKIPRHEAASLAAEAHQIIELLRTLVNEVPAVTNPGNQSSVVGAVVSLQIVGRDPDGGPVTWTATGLPPGLAISPTSGLISGTITSATGSPYAVTVTARDTDTPQKSCSASFRWTVTPPAGQAPVVSNPGLQSAVVGAWVSLQVVGWDPDGGGVTWSASGLPGGLSINASTGLVSGTVTGAPGDYVVTVTARDTDVPQMSGSASFTWRVSSGSGAAAVVEVRVRSSGDDVEEQPDGWLYVDSSDLELVRDGGVIQKVGVRFGGVSVPKGAVIVGAWIQFTVDECSTGSVSLRIRADDVGNAAGFSGSFGVSGRVATGASVMWSPPDWTAVGEAGVNQRTPGLVSLVQAIVNRADWVSGNAMAFLIDGSGWRTAESYDGYPAAAPLLHIEYRTP